MTARTRFPLTTIPSRLSPRLMRRWPRLPSCGSSLSTTSPSSAYRPILAFDSGPFRWS